MNRISFCLLQECNNGFITFFFNRAQGSTRKVKSSAFSLCERPESVQRDQRYVSKEIRDKCLKRSEISVQRDQFFLAASPLVSSSEQREKKPLVHRVIRDKCPKRSEIGIPKASQVD